MRTNFSIIVGIVLILGFSACEKTAQTSTKRPVRLTPAMFTRYEFTLISDKYYLDYWFPAEGMAEEDFGQKNGGVVGLGEGWRIDNTNTLVFTAVTDVGTGITNPVTHSLQFKSFGEEIVATTDGQRFKRTKIKEPD